MVEAIRVGMLNWPQWSFPDLGCSAPSLLPPFLQDLGPRDHSAGKSMQ